MPFFVNGFVGGATSKMFRSITTINKLIYFISYFIAAVIVLSIVLSIVIFMLNHMGEDRIWEESSNMSNESNDNTGQMTDLDANGFCICKNVLDESEIADLKGDCEHDNYKAAKEKLIKNEHLNHIIKSLTGGENYIFQDYIWIIQKSSVHTCHRDNNGDFFNENQQYPSYTMLIYLEDMEKCLGVIPNSHKYISSYSVNLTDPVANILCNKGDVILFNANLIHVGTINKKNDNIRIQMKVSHKDDINTLSYYQNFNKVLNQDNTIPVYARQIQKKASCMFPIFANITQSANIQSARGSDNGAKIGIPQKLFSYVFYGNKDFYDLPNAF